MSGDPRSEDNLFTAARRVVRNILADYGAHGGLLSLDTIKANDILARWVEVEDRRLKKEAEVIQMNRQPKLYDPACDELAHYFLDDREPTPEQVADLAWTIQQAIEDWLTHEDGHKQDARSQP